MFNRENNKPGFLFYSTSKRWLAALLLTVPLLSGCYTQLFSLSFDALFVLIEIIGIPFIIYALIRMITVQMASRFMKIKSAEEAFAEQHNKTETITPAHQIIFEEHREKENLPLNNEMANDFVSAITAGNSGWQLFKKTSLLFISGAVVILFIIRFFYGEWMLITTVFLLLLTGVMFLSVYLRYLSLRRLPPASVYTAYIVMMIIFFFIAGMFPVVRPYFVFYTVLLSITLVFVLTGYIRNRSKDPLNRQLLILRIFGADSHTAFLFRELSRTWRFLGSLITIADPSYLRYQYSLSSAENRRRFFAFFILYFFVLIFLINIFQEKLADSLPTGAVLIWEQMSGLSAAFVFGLIIMILILISVLPLIIIVIYRGFISGMAKLEKAIQRITAGKRSIDGTFKNSTLFCIDNTWGKTVEQMLAVSKVVLMDLRGFSNQHKGCEYELGLLINSYPVNKIVLLADDEPNLELIKDILKTRWEQMGAASPNADLPEPILKIYFPGIEDKSDILRIIALLSMGLANKKEEQVAGIGIQQEITASTLQSKKLKLPGGVVITEDGMLIKAMPNVHTKTSTGAGRFQKIDLALAKPSVGKWLIPLLLLLLGGRFIYTLYPIVRSYTAYNNVKKVQALPGQQNSIDTTGIPNITATVTSKHDYNITIQTKYDEKLLDWSVSVTGGKLGAAYKYGSVKINPFTIDGKKLPDATGEDYGYEPKTWLIPHENQGDSSRISFTRVSSGETNTGNIAIMKGKMKLYFIAPQDKFTVNELGSLLAETGLLEIELHDSSYVKRLWLQRSLSSPGEVNIIYRGNWKDYEVRLLNKNGELENSDAKEMTIRFNSNSNKTGPFRFADLKNAWVEIIPKKKFRIEKWSFETRNFNVKQDN